ncbi:hypothetical protein YC2023_018568 [Brassica napus]
MAEALALRENLEPANTTRDLQKQQRTPVEVEPVTCRSNKTTPIVSKQVSKPKKLLLLLIIAFIKTQPLSEHHITFRAFITATNHPSSINTQKLLLVQFTFRASLYFQRISINTLKLLLLQFTLINTTRNLPTQLQF